MSRHNKVNPDHYTLAGRLSPDDLAREHRKQSESPFGRGRARGQKATPPWLANEQGGGNRGGGNQEDLFGETAERNEARNRHDEVEGGEARDLQPAGGEQAQQPQGKPRRNAMGKQGSPKSARPTGQKNRARKKRERRVAEVSKQTTRTGITTGARSAAAKPRSRPKASGASATPRSGKAPKARGTAPKKGTRQAASRKAARGPRKTTRAAKGTRSTGTARKTARKRR